MTKRRAPNGRERNRRRRLEIGRKAAKTKRKLRQKAKEKRDERTG